jgi:hypothetical protein
MSNNVLSPFKMIDINVNLKNAILNSILILGEPLPVGSVIQYASIKNISNVSLNPATTFDVSLYTSTGNVSDLPTIPIPALVYTGPINIFTAVGTPACSGATLNSKSIVSSGAGYVPLLPTTTPVPSMPATLPLGAVPLGALLPVYPVLKVVGLGAAETAILNIKISVLCP